MKNTIPFVLAAGIASGCDKIEEVDCSEVDETLYAAQIDDFNNPDFQSLLRERFQAVGLDALLSPQDLAETGDILDLRCASSIKIARLNGSEAVMATDTRKNTLWVDVSSDMYLPHQETFALSLEADDVDAELNRYYGIGGVIHMTAHEFAHDLNPDSDHSEETRQFFDAIPRDNEMTQCEGWTYVAEGTDDFAFDVQAEVACAYDSYEPWL